MFRKKIKIFLLILIMIFFAVGTIFSSDNNVASEDVLVRNVKTAKTKNKKEKALKALFYYYVNNNRYDDVIAVSDDVLKYKLTKKEKYTIYYNSAIAYKIKKKYESAIEAAQEAEYLYSKKIDVKMLMGEVYMDNGLYELAASKFKNVLELDDKHVTALTNLGNIYMMQENYKAALEYYNRAISIRKNLPVKTYINTAVAYKEVGNIDKSIDILENLQEKNKVSAFILAKIYKMKKDFAKAKNVLLPYVYGKDFDLEIYCELAEIYLLSKDYDEAKNLMLFYKSKIKEENIEMLDFLLAEAYYGLNDKKNAVKLMNDILKYTKSDYIKGIVKRTLKIRKL